MPDTRCAGLPAATPTHLLKSASRFRLLFLQGAADPIYIDHAKIVWAREIPGLDPKPLFDYFRDRTVWVVEADAVPARLQPYRAPAAPEAMRDSSP